MKIKRLIRNSLEKIFGKKIEKVVVDKEIKVVSLDVFDTLVVRNVPVPEDVFELVNIQYNKTHPKNDFRVSFRMLRVNAEKLAREKKGKKEVTLEEIYQCMSEIDDKSKKELMQIEIETECAICQPNCETRDYFEYLVETDVTIVITSDMYLPKSVVKSILEKCGYSKYTKLYVSSEYGDTKSAGTLFDRIIDDFQIKDKELLHIGDNFKADYWIPREKGIKTFLYKKRMDKPYFFKRLNKGRKWQTEEERLQFQMLRCIIANSGMKQKQNERIGYEILGPILLGYSMWLKNQIESKKTETLVFLAREGALLKKAFETLYESEAKTYYINVSRLALCRANAINVSSWQELERLFVDFMRSVETVEDFFRLVGIAETEKTLFQQYGIDCSKCIDEIENKEALFELIRLHGKSYFEEQNQLLKEYLENNGFREKRVAVLDIGWLGTIQMLLAKILPDIVLEGYYFAVSSFRKDKEYVQCQRSGYFCNLKEWETDGKMINFSRIPLEQLFFCNEGTTLEYRRENGKVIPLKAELENRGAGIKIIEDVQYGAIQFLEDCRKVNLPFFFEEIDRKVAFEPCFLFMLFPKKGTLSFYRKLQYVEGVKHISFLPKNHFIFYLFHPMEAKKEFEANSSRIIWLKGLLRIPFPYYRCLIFLVEKIGLKSSFKKKYFQ